MTKSSSTIRLLTKKCKASCVVSKKEIFQKKKQKVTSWWTNEIKEKEKSWKNTYKFKEKRPKVKDIVQILVIKGKKE